MTDPIYGPGGANGSSCSWCKAWLPKSEYDAHALVCPKLKEIFDLAPPEVRAARDAAVAALMAPPAYVWTGVTLPTPEMLAEAMTLSRCAYVSEHGERCQRVPVIGFAGHCQMHGSDFAREFMGPEASAKPLPLPCPYCGGSSQAKSALGKAFVCCGRCGALGPVISEPDSTPESCERFAVESWNVVAGLKGKLARLVEKLDGLIAEVKADG